MMPAHMNGFLLTLLWLPWLPTHLVNGQLVTYIVGADPDDPLNIGISASAQLAPVYNPNGELLQPSLSSVHLVENAQPTGRAMDSSKKRFVTETVYGFLDFTTTVGSTVMVFTPQSEKEVKKSEPTALKPTSKVKIVAATALTENIVSTQAPFPTPKASKTPPPTSKATTPSQPHTNHKTSPLPPIQKTTPLAPITENPISTNEPTGLAKLLKEALSLRGKNTENSFNDDFNKKALKKPEFSNKKQGGSTIVPITVEGTGATVLISKTPVLESSIYMPEEVVISMSQAFPPISVVGPFDTRINNVIDKNFNNYDYLASEPTPSINEQYSVAEVTSKNKRKLKPKPKPVGLVTTLGGTTISDGQTIIHQTSVIGTYVDGQYAQVLKSTSRIFRDDPLLENLITPTPNYETVKAVIEGSATQFFTPEASASLPIESLFSTAERVPRQESRLENLRSKLTKRRGTNPNEKDDYYYDAAKEQYYDDYEDLHQAGSGPRNVYSSITPTRPLQPKAQPSTFRPRQKQPAGTRNIPPSILRNSPPPENLNRNKNNQFRLSSARPNLKHTRTPPGIFKKQEEQSEAQEEASEQSPTSVKGSTEETLRVVTKKPSDGVTDVWYEVATLRSLHTFRVGATKNTRHVTYTKTFTHSIEATPQPKLAPSEKSSIFEDPPLFENILDKPKEIATLPPINLQGNDLNEILKTTTETFQTTETMYKTSVLPVKLNADSVNYHTLTQTYFITRIVVAVKTIPPFEAFEFVPGDSLNEFNGKLLAEGTENEDSLLPEEREYDENGEVRVRPPPGFKMSDSNLADLAGGKFNPDALEKQTNPELAAAIQTHKTAPAKAPQLSGTKEGIPPANANNGATPPLSPEALQLAYLRLMNPYMFGGGFPGAQPQTTVTSSPVVITTDVTLTDTRVLKVIFNARPIYTTISSTEVVRTTITSYATSTVTVSPGLSGFGGFPFPGAPFPTG